MVISVQSLFLQMLKHYVNMLIMLISVQSLYLQTANYTNLKLFIKHAFLYHKLVITNGLEHKWKKSF